MTARVAASLPSLRATVFGSVAWAIVNAASAYLGLWMRDWQAGYFSVVLIFALGGTLAFAPAYASSHLIAARSPRERRFAAAFVLLAVLTIGLTAALFAVEYRIYYAQWHADFPSMVWGFQLFFTSAAAVYQFAVLGLRLYFPFGFLALFIAAAWIAGRLR
ncbi:MAG: hypothetical protein AB7O76_13055 [Rhizobiaceae bacterium]